MFRLFSSSMKPGSKIKMSWPTHFGKRINIRPALQLHSFTAKILHGWRGANGFTLHWAHGYLAKKTDKKWLQKWLQKTSLKCDAIKIKSYLLNSQLRPISVNDAVPLWHTRLPGDQIKTWALAKEKKIQFKCSNKLPL